jgi:hypothetical protein
MGIWPELVLRQLEVVAQQFRLCRATSKNAKLDRTQSLSPG